MKFVANCYEKYSRFNEKAAGECGMTEKQWREWRSQFVIGEPQATEKLTANELKNIGMVGLYSPEPGMTIRYPAVGIMDKKQLREIVSFVECAACSSIHSSELSGKRCHCGEIIPEPTLEQARNVMRNMNWDSYNGIQL